MAKKKKQEAPPQPRINPEIQAADRDYRREVAITESGPRLRRALLFLWASIDIILLVIFIGYLGFYLTVAATAERRHIARIGENIETNNAITAARSAQSLQLGSVQVYTLENGEYDLYVEIENVNEEWYATFDYHFERSGERSETETGFVLPGESRPLISFRQTFSTRPVGAEVVIENLTWQRVDAHEIVDIPAWMAEHNEFELKNGSYALDVQVGDQRIGQSTFTVENNSPYSYFDAEFSVLILRGNVIAGVNTATIAGFEAGESRDVTVNWFAGAPSSGSVEVVPNINFFDENVYMSPAGDIGTDIRDQF